MGFGALALLALAFFTIYSWMTSKPPDDEDKIY